MTRRLPLSCLLVVALAGGAIAATDPFVAGNAAASAGDHGTAAAAFEHEIATEGWSPGALLGLGNAYAGQRQHGPAILAYERGLLLAPRDEALRTNLAREREAAGITVPPPSRTEAVLARLSVDAWTWLAFGAGALAAAGIVGFAWSRRRSLAGGLVIVGALACVAASAAAHVVAPSESAAVVVRSGTARIAPFGQAEPAFEVTGGESVEIEEAHGDFVYVREGTRAGWLPRAAVERVVTDRPPSPA